MTKDEIKQMFLLNAEVQKIPACDKRYEMARSILENVTKKYVAENVDAVNSAPDAGTADVPDWQRALGNLSEIFRRLDSVEKSDAAVKARAEDWDVISTAVTVFYQDPSLEPLRKKIAELKAAQANQEPVQE